MAPLIPPVIIFSSTLGLQFTHTVDLNGDSKCDLLVSFFGGPTKRAGVVAFTNLGGGAFRSTVLSADPLYTIAALKPASIHPVGKLPGLRGILLPPLSPEPTIGGDHVIALFPATAIPGASRFTLMIRVAPARKLWPTETSMPMAVLTLPPSITTIICWFSLNTTTAATCVYPGSAGVRICSPLAGSTQNSPAAIHASASGGALPIVAMKAYIDGNQVAASDMNTLDASCARRPRQSHLDCQRLGPKRQAVSKRCQICGAIVVARSLTI